MKAIIFSLLLITSSSICRSQSPASIRYLDSLHLQLSLSKHDSSRILVMAELCNIYRTSKPDSALFYGEKALSMAQSINFSKGLVRTYAQVGRVYADIGNLPKALKMQFKAIQIAEENKLLYEEASPLEYVASIYAVLKNYSKTHSYYLKTKKIYEVYQDKEKIAFIDMNLGSVFDNMNQLDSSLHYLTNAYNGMKDTKSGIHPYWYRAMGRIQYKLGNDSLALAYLHHGIQVAREYNNHRILAFELNDVSSLYKKQNQIDSSILYAKLALNAAEKISFKQHIFIASTQLAELYEPIDSKIAVTYYKIAAEAKDSLFNLGNIHTITQEEENLKEIENQKEIYQNKLKQFALSVGLGILLLIAFFLSRNNQKEKKAKNLLKAKNEEIENTLSRLKSTQSQLIQSEKMASLGELTAGIAHEIQNPLNFVNNFSELNNELANELSTELTLGNVEQSKDLVNDIRENSQKIYYHGQRASSIVKGMLEHSRSSTGIKEPTDINKLCDEFVRLSYHGLRAKDKSFNCDYKLDLDSNLPLVNVVSQDIGRVLLNIINNAFQACFQQLESRKSGSQEFKPLVSIITKFSASLRLSETHSSQQICEISISDNGPGIPSIIKDKIFQPFFTTKPTGQGTGLGLSLAYDIVKAHGGSLEVKSTEGAGSEFVIYLPLKANG